MGARWGLAIVALVSGVAAQTFSACNPSREVPAIGRTVSCDFTKDKCDDLFKQLPGSTVKYDDKDGVQFIIAKPREAPTLATSTYLFFGRLDVELKAMSGKGLVTSLVLQSDSLDEVDLEWVGSQKDKLDTNYFTKGNTEGGDAQKRARGGTHTFSNLTDSFHNYTIQWTPRSISWSIDGKEFRVEGRSPNDKGDTFPQTPAQLKLGAWVAGAPGNSDGTVQWAGGIADFAAGPGVAAVRRVTITDFGGGDALPKMRTKEYQYMNRNGTYQSIKVVATDEENEAPSPGTTTSGVQTPDPTANPPSDSDDDPKPGDRKLAPGAIAGIVIGSIAAVALVLAAAFLLRRSRKQAAASAAEDPSSPTSERTTDELDGWKRDEGLPAEMNGEREAQEVHAEGLPLEMNGIGLPQEMDTKREPVELDSTPVWRDKPLI